MKKNSRKIIKYTLLSLFSCLILFLFKTCFIIVRADKYNRNSSTEQVEAYSIYKAAYSDNFSKIKRQYDPPRELYLDFPYDFLDEVYDEKTIAIWGRLFIQEPYQTLRIHELSLVINGKVHTLIRNQEFRIKPLSGDNLLVDEENNIFLMQDKPVYWISVELYELPRRYLRGKLHGSKEIVIRQSYSFDDSETRTDEVRYGVEPGGYVVSLNRVLTYMFPP